MAPDSWEAQASSTKWHVLAGNRAEPANLLDREDRNGASGLNAGGSSKSTEGRQLRAVVHFR